MFPRCEQLDSDQLQVREVPPGPEAGPEDSDRPQAPTKDHWNIALDLIFPWTLEDSWWQRKAKRVAQAQKEKSKGAETSQTEAPTPGEPRELEVGGNGKALPTRMAPIRE